MYQECDRLGSSLPAWHCSEEGPVLSEAAQGCFIICSHHVPQTERLISEPTTISVSLTPSEQQGSPGFLGIRTSDWSCSVHSGSQGQVL